MGIRGLISLFPGNTWPPRPVRPSPKPAAFAAAFTFRLMWLADRPYIGVDGSTHREYLRQDVLQDLGGFSANVRDRALSLGIRLGAADVEKRRAVILDLHVALPQH